MAKHLAKTYGSRAWEVCELADSIPNGKQQLLKNYPYLMVDVVWACREYACTVEDVLSRRTRLAFLNKEAAMKVIPIVADIMAKELGWSKEVKKTQSMAAEEYVSSYAVQLPEGTTEDEAKSAFG